MDWPCVGSSSQWRNWLAVAMMPLLATAVLGLALRPPHVRQTPPPEGAVVEDLMQRRVPLKAPAQRVMFDQPMVWHYMTVDETDDRSGGNTGVCLSVLADAGQGVEP